AAAPAATRPQALLGRRRPSAAPTPMRPASLIGLAPRRASRDLTGAARSRSSPRRRRGAPGRRARPRRAGGPKRLARRAQTRADEAGPARAWRRHAAPAAARRAVPRRRPGSPSPAARVRPPRPGGPPRRARRRPRSAGRRARPQRACARRAAAPGASGPARRADPRAARPRPRGGSRHERSAPPPGLAAAAPTALPHHVGRESPAPARSRLPRRCSRAGPRPRRAGRGAPRRAQGAGARSPAHSPARRLAPGPARPHPGVVQVPCSALATAQMAAISASCAVSHKARRAVRYSAEGEAVGSKLLGDLPLGRLTLAAGERLVAVRAQPDSPCVDARVRRSVDLAANRLTGLAQLVAGEASPRGPLAFVGLRDEGACLGLSRSRLRDPLLRLRVRGPKPLRALLGAAARRLVARARGPACRRGEPAVAASLAVRVRPLGREPRQLRAALCLLTEDALLGLVASGEALLGLPGEPLGGDLAGRAGAIAGHAGQTASGTGPCGPRAAYAVAQRRHHAAR